MRVLSGDSCRPSPGAIPRVMGADGAKMAGDDLAMAVDPEAQGVGGGDDGGRETGLSSTHPPKKKSKPKIKHSDNYQKDNIFYLAMRIAKSEHFEKLAGAGGV